ncbi:RNase adapter RapZ [Microbispora sp. H10949]|uniref:RapZ C-terminal domain-containing protein n=1 Tax=Microbispora sp. H10949 TaxID=2729111 RepID=UPI001602A0BD|nr:RNase adapter RapZ [Microbispora sp. H10949]
MNHVNIVSFGYGHAPAPQADITIDTRRHLRNPHHNPDMRELTGLDPAVRRHVLDTTGARCLIRHTAVCVTDLLNGLPRSPVLVVTIAIGCVGGRHRSVALAEELAAILREHGIGVQLAHRDVTKPIIQRTG